jgi:hypothetical protein
MAASDRAGWQHRPAPSRARRAAAEGRHGPRQELGQAQLAQPPPGGVLVNPVSGAAAGLTGLPAYGPGTGAGTLPVALSLWFVERRRGALGSPKR